ncbi:hypothetical protein G6F63_015492 [Rhizopus arrhizus]|nr:hypothetical protein G6F63_015492 [Rhizopus arrhizus]
MRAGTSAPIFGPHLRGGDDARLRERILQRGQAEVIVRVAVADVDGGQLLAAGAHHVAHFCSLRFAELRIDQDGVVLAADQHRRHREDGVVAGVEMGQRQAGAGGVGRGDQRGNGGGLQ